LTLCATSTLCVLALAGCSDVIAPQNPGSGGTAGDGGAGGGGMGGDGGMGGAAHIDECAVDNGGCDDNATCFNTPDGRSCSCNANFVGDGETCRQIWTLVGSLPNTNLDPEGFGAIASAAGSRMFFGPRSNDPFLRFMRSFNVATQIFGGPHTLPPGSQTDFCACGFTSVFLSDGTELYLLGNRGERYTPTTDTWTPVTSYVDPYRRGEAAGAFDPISNLFLLIGGRDTERSAIRMAVDTEVFSAEPGTLPASMDSAVAHTMPGTSLTYVAGGDFNNGVALLSHVTGTSIWTRLADAPFPLGRPAAMGHFDEKIWVANRFGFFFYDPATDNWTTTPVAAPEDLVTAVNVAQSTYALVQNGTTLEVHRLSAIE
jgi:hypothetical protein